MVDRSSDCHRFAGKVVLVTGAARGLGLGAAERFVAEGAQVWIADIDERVETVATKIEATAGVRCDAADTGQIDRLFARCLDRHSRIDVVVANAGIGGGADIAKMTDEAYRTVMANNLDSVFYTCRAAARSMLPQGSGVILTVGSVFGREAPARVAAYGASKAGVIALTQSVAAEMAPHGIRVNCISPGHMGTDLYWAALERRAAATGRTFEEMVEEEKSDIPMARFGTNADMGGLAAFLASDDAAYITGQTINLDGGLQMR